MGWFSKSKEKQTEVNKANHTQDSVSTNLLDGALDTLAELIRNLGEYAFDLESMTAGDFDKYCQSWARHVLTGVPAKTQRDGPGDKDEEDGSSAQHEEKGERSWTELRYFLRLHRKDEQRFVQTQLEEMKDVIIAFVESFQNITGDDRAEKTIERSLLDLEKSAKSGSLENMRQTLAQTAETIRDAVKEQQTSLHEQTKQLGARLGKLQTYLLEAKPDMKLDPLTQVLDRRGFETALDRYVTLSNFFDQPMVLLLATIDDFKTIKEKHARPVVDQVIQSVANNMIKSFPRINDLVCRYGEKEFVALLHDCDAKTIARLADRFLDRVRKETVEDKGDLISVTCSVGLAQLHRGDKPQSVLERTTKATSQARQSGGNQAAVYEAE